MDIIIYLGSLLAGFCLSLFWKPDHITINKLAKAYLVVQLLLAVIAWLFYFAGIRNATSLQVLRQILKWAPIIARLTLGFLVGRLALGIKGVPPRSDAFRGILYPILWAVSISIGNSFIMSTVGKLKDMPDITNFFLQSGYAVWFLYFIIAAETAGAIGILLHFKLKTGILATVGLALIMLGAVYTHWHNGDPFSDSYAAVCQLIIQSLLLFLFYLERKAHRPQPLPER